jgi:hypothetical protein
MTRQQILALKIGDLVTYGEYAEFPLPVVDVSRPALDPMGRVGRCFWLSWEGLPFPCATVEGEPLYTIQE